jgi:hypothetical protein
MLQSATLELLHWNFDPTARSRESASWLRIDTERRMSQAARIPEQPRAIRMLPLTFSRPLGARHVCHCLVRWCFIRNISMSGHDGWPQDRPWAS